jgi:hypothetical protein
MRIRAEALCVAGLAFLAAGSAHGQDVNFGIEKYGSFTQTGDSDVNLSSWFGVFSLYSHTIGAFADPCDVTYVGPMSPEALGIVYDVAPYGQLWYGYTPLYQTPEALATDFPATDYLFNFTGNVLPGGAFTLTLPPDSFPPENPQLTGDTYSRLQVLKDNLAADFTADINGFTDDPTSNNSAIGIEIKDLGPGEIWYSSSLLPSDSSFTIPGGTFDSGRAYVVYLTYSIGHLDTAGGLNGGYTTVGWEKDTTILFNTRGPCPADLNGDGVVDDADFVLFAFAYNLLYCFDPAMPDKCPADLTNDGYVLDDDFSLFAVAYDALLCPA